MRKIIVHEFITLDGVIQAPGGKSEDTDGNFKFGGWTVPFWHNDIGKKFFETMQTADALLLGKKTWQIHSVFNSMNDDFAKAMNSIPKYVVSNSLKDTSAWRNTTIISGDVVEEIKNLKSQKGKNILIDGSSVLLKTLIENNLVDKFLLHVYPLVLGGGKKLFTVDNKINLKLVETKTLPTGVVFTEYNLNK